MTQAQLRLNVPFSAKDQAKALGARWDPQQRSWYVPFGVDIQPFQTWWPDHLKAQGGEALAKRDQADARARTVVANAAFVTGPARVATDHSDKLPWED